MLLAVPRRTVGGHALVCDVEQGLVAVHHHSAVSKLLEPQSGVGGFTGAAFRCKQIRLSIHRHHGTVHQQDIVLHQQLRQFAVDRQRFQIWGCILPHCRTFQLVCPHRAFPLVCNVGRRGSDTVFGIIFYPVGCTQRIHL